MISLKNLGDGAKKMNEEQNRIAGASYIVNFLTDVQKLTECFATYTNLLIEFESKFGNTDLKTFGDDERNALNTTVQALRFYAIKSYTQFKSIQKTVKLDVSSEELDVKYKVLTKDFIPSRDNVSEFVIEINALLLGNIIKDLLTTSNDLVNQIYGNR